MSLPKVISQETFDAVVLENVVEFDNSLEEAIIEATRDFDAQGVHLSNIIKQVSLNANKDKIFHPILEALELIRKATSTTSEDSSATVSSEAIIVPLNTFAEECRISLAHRVLGTKNGAYSYLLRLINASKDSEDVLLAALQGMQAATDGNPDILDKPGVALMKELMDQWAPNMASNVMECLARWCHSSNVKHETNRCLLFEAQIPKSLVSSLALCSSAPHKQRILATLKAIKSYTLDDDIRAEFGTAHENARYFVEEERLIPVCLQLIKGGVECGCSIVVGEALSTLTSVCLRAEYCKMACDAGAIDIIAKIFDQFPDITLLNKQSLGLLTTLAGDDKVKVQVVESGIHLHIPHIMDKHQMNASLCNSGCSCVSMLSLRHPQNAKALVQCGAAQSIVQAMKQHPKEKQLQKMGCLAIRNLCSRSPENVAALQEMEADTAVRAAMDSHGEHIRDMAKGALRDLGVEVALVEQWHGKGHEIEQGY